MTIPQQLAMKIKMERIFKKEVTKIFNSIARDFRISVAATGMPPSMAVYKPVWEVALNMHYKRVQRAFTGVVKQFGIGDILSVFLTWRNIRAKQQAEEITETTKNNMNESLQLADIAAVEEGVALTSIERAANSTAILKGKFKSRTQALINTETQSAAEAAKFMEAELLSDVKPRILGGREESDTTKKWTTVGDDRVRRIHREANGQIRKLNEPYLVGGEYLMHPGDLSLGASLANVANCRCISTYKFY